MNALKNAFIVSRSLLEPIEKTLQSHEYVRANSTDKSSISFTYITIYIICNRPIDITKLNAIRMLLGLVDVSPTQYVYVYVIVVMQPLSTRSVFLSSAALLEHRRTHLYMHVHIRFSSLRRWRNTCSENSDVRCEIAEPRTNVCSLKHFIPSSNTLVCRRLASFAPCIFSTTTTTKKKTVQHERG